MNEINLNKIKSLGDLASDFSEEKISLPVVLYTGNLRYFVNEDNYDGFIKGLKVAALVFEIEDK